MRHRNSHSVRCEKTHRGVVAPCFGEINGALNSSFEALEEVTLREKRLPIDLDGVVQEQVPLVPQTSIRQFFLEIPALTEGAPGFDQLIRIVSSIH